MFCLGYSDWWFNYKPPYLSAVNPPYLLPGSVGLEFRKGTRGWLIPTP